MGQCNVTYGRRSLPVEKNIVQPELTLAVQQVNTVLRFQRLLNLAASAGIRRNLARFAADADYDRSSAHDSGGPAVFGQFTQDVASIPAMRSSLYVVSLGRIHYFYLRHNADPKRTSSRLRSGVVFSSRKRRVSDHGPARQRRDPWGERPGGVRRDSTSTASVGSRYMRTTRSSSSIKQFRRGA